MPSKKRGKYVEPVTRTMPSLSENIQYLDHTSLAKALLRVKYLQEIKIQEKFLGKHVNVIIIIKVKRNLNEQYYTYFAA